MIVAASGGSGSGLSGKLTGHTAAPKCARTEIATAASKTRRGDLDAARSQYSGVMVCRSLKLSRAYRGNDQGGIGGALVAST